MVGVKSLITAGAATIIATAAYAADMPVPQPQIPYQPLVLEQPLGAWYLRGDIGVGVLSFSQFDFTQTNSAFVWPSTWAVVQQDTQDTAIFGFGVGYEFNSWLRFDVTGEYRTKAALKATGSYTNFCAGGGTCFDINQANYSAEVFMANAYIDLGTWWCLTPYIGGGIGGAYNTISGIQDTGINSDGTNGFGFASANNSSFSFAWNLQGGLTYSVTNNFKVDFNFRYLNLGSPVSAVVQCQNTPSCPAAYYTFKQMTSEDFRIGLRWILQPEAAVGVMTAAQPVVTAPPMLAPQPQYVPVPPPQYTPAPPPYAPAPLQSRG